MRERTTIEIKRDQRQLVKIVAARKSLRMKEVLERLVKFALEHLEEIFPKTTTQENKQ